MKRIFTLFLAMMMAMSLSITAFAAAPSPVVSGSQNDTKGSVVINEVNTLITYSVYKILDLHTFNSVENAYTYKVAAGWEDFFNKDAIKKYVSVDSTGLVKWIWDASGVATDDPIKTLNDASADLAKQALDYAKDNGIPVGPGRGSAAGSIVAYALKITDIDTLKFNLLFERFLNPSRIEEPDVDTDISKVHRSQAIEYLKKQKGKVICLNDTEDEIDFELHKEMIIAAFEELLPDKSSFEL